ncbi:mucin-2 isoform X2 [Aedes albopictus]|uniref:Insect pheromone-binding family n=1 Tax=Aedes albopictus TaxID=7160 RepID=A0ABM1ZDV0_AEDAL|nr:nuclear pore complex protein DDB_G0274915-like isoform X2 [Aedes albopictus]
MRNVWILVASALLAFANFVKSQDTARNLYSSRYDNLDIDTILGSSRLVNNYVDCLLSRKPCPPEGKDLKRILPEALRTKCARCSATQKENALKIITTLYYQYPEQYMALRERWDPSGEYHRRFEEYIAGLQFNQIGSNGNDRPVRNDFDRDQSQVLLQTLILSTTTVAPPPPPPPSPLPSQNALPNGPEQPRPQQLAPSAQLTQPVAPVSLTSTTTASSTSTTTLPTTTTTSTTTEAATTTTRTTTTTTTAGTTSTVPSSSSMTNSAAAVGTTSRTVAPVINPLPSWMFDRRPQEQQSQQLQQVQQSTSTNTVQSRPSQLVANGAQNSDQSNGSQNFNRPLNLAEPDATTTARTTPLITTTRLILRPVDGLDFSTNTRPTVGTLGNRFGGEDPSTASGSSAAEFGTTAPSPAATVRPTTRPVVRQTTSRIVTPRPTPNRFQFEAAPAGAIPVFRPQQPQQQQPGQVQVFAQPAQPQAPSQTQVITSSSSFAVGVGPTMTTPNNVIDNFFIPPGQGGGFGATNNNQNNPNASPFVGLFNSIGNKLATTADAIAGMLRRTVDVLVSTHLQAHQQRRSVRSN